MHGLTFAYSPSVFLVVTFRLLNPPPCGVVIGAFKKTFVLLKDSHASGLIPAVCPLS
jgi:hypothetical protein